LAAEVDGQIGERSNLLWIGRLAVSALPGSGIQLPR
jgi:hypothetical protein